MKRVMFVGLLLLAGCRGNKSTSSFDRAFDEALKTNGQDKPLVISGDKGKSLQTNVQRVGDPFPPAGAERAAKIPATLSPRTLARILRRKVSRLKYCMFDTSVRGRAGKAILTLSIDSNGHVTHVKVQAPAFRGTALASCIRRSAELWRFPKFKSGTVTHSYPIIFRGR